MQCALGESITLAKTASLVSITGKQILHSVAFILGSETTRLLHDDHHGDGNIRDGKDIAKTLENELLIS